MTRGDRTAEEVAVHNIQALARKSRGDAEGRTAEKRRIAARFLTISIPGRGKMGPGR